MSGATTRRLKPALLSAAAFPGLGQLANGHTWRALGFGGTSLLLLVLFVRRIWSEASRRMPGELDALLDVSLPFRLAQEIHDANASFFFWTTLALLALWASSVVDAWFGAADAGRGAQRVTGERGG